MKNFKNYLSAIAFISLVGVMSCNPDPDEPAPPIAKEAGEVLAAGTWAPTTGGITNENTPRDEWEGFQVTFTVNEDDFASGRYTAGPLPTEDDAALVWKTSGEWAFAVNSDGTPDLNTIIRDGDTSTPVSVTISGDRDGDGNVTGGNLRMEFNIPDPDARLDGFYGTWVFTFEF
jgi:hypothetical protein